MAKTRIALRFIQDKKKKQAGAELCQAQGKFSLAYHSIGEAISVQLGLQLPTWTELGNNIL